MTTYFVEDTEGGALFETALEANAYAALLLAGVSPNTAYGLAYRPVST